MIRNLTLLLLICGLLFSGVSFVKSLSDAKPDKDFFYALSKIPKNSVVLSSVDNSYWINYAGMRSVVRYGKTDDELEQDISTIFETKTLNNVLVLLDKYGVSFILVDSKMNKDLSWDGKGLLFFLKYSDKFKLVYEDNGIEVWEYLR